MPKLGDFAASTTTTIQVQFVPQFIFFPDVTTVPTLLQIEVLGEGGTILNLDGAGCDVMNNINAKGSVANGYVFQLADGLIKEKTVQITMTNAVAGTISAYGYSPNGEGSAYAKYEKNTILADSGATFQDFAVLGFDSPTAQDIFNVQLTGGGSDKIGVEEIESYQQIFQNYNPVAEGLIINNTAQQYKSVEVIPSTDRGVYVLSYKPV